MKYVAIDDENAVGNVIATPLHIYAGQRTDRDAGKVTACGLILPSSSTVYTQPGVLNVGPLCGDCFPRLTRG